MKQPPFKDFKFWRSKKKDTWEEVELPCPPLETHVADSHAHITHRSDPQWELERALHHKVSLIANIVDPIDDGFDCVNLVDNLAIPSGLKVVHLIGVHPHNADHYTDKIEREIEENLSRSNVVAVGEIGLDYYYDMSDRDAQRTVFIQQMRLAQKYDMPVALHLRSSAGKGCTNAHDEALQILEDLEVDFSKILLHCCTLPKDALMPWVEKDAYIAYGGAITFNGSDDIREGMRMVPDNRILFETDSPYMTPHPMRGVNCTPSHVIFTAAAIAEQRAKQPGTERKAFLEQVFQNTLNIYRINV